MMVLGIETSCDECSVAVVEDGKRILSNVVHTQVEDHRKFEGVVPELASRLHTERIATVFKESLIQAGISLKDIDGIAVTNRPGLSGSLLVGLNFAKGLSASLNRPFIGIDHILAHLYAPLLEEDAEYPFLGVLVSGGHTIICIVHSYDFAEVLGTTIDDAIGEAFDKVAKHYRLGYPGGAVIDTLAQNGNPSVFNFPSPRLKSQFREYDVSYSGLKTAVINQLDKFWDHRNEKSLENIAASFQHRAVTILIDSIKKALTSTGLKIIAAGGGVAANSLLRASLKKLEKTQQVNTIIPSLSLCTDNGAMTAGIGYHYLKENRVSDYESGVSARVSAFKSPQWDKMGKK